MPARMQPKTSNKAKRERAKVKDSLRGKTAEITVLEDGNFATEESKRVLSIDPN